LRRTDKQTDKQMDSIDTLSRSRCRERRLNKCWKRYECSRSPKPKHYYENKNTFYRTRVSVSLSKFCEKLLSHARFHWNRAIGCWVMATNDL